VQREIRAPPESRTPEMGGAREIGAPPENRKSEEGGAGREVSTA